MKRTISKSWLTDFCDSIRLFMSVIFIQIVVVIYSLSFLSFEWEFLRKLSILTLLSQLVGLSLLILMCKFSKHFNRLSVVPGVTLLTLLVVIFTSILTQVIGYLSLQLMFDLFKNQQSVNYLNIKLSVSSVLICWALVRYFYIQDQWEYQVLKLSEARLNALQARIKPHFLFNSLNSIASLIGVDSNRAEEAITDFSGLMRKAFMHKEKNITIDKELDWVRQYLAIEKLRLASRLTYTICCEEQLENKKIPVLCLQPLVENAVLHGIAPLESGGLIEIKIYSKNNSIVIRVTNPYGIEVNKQSNGMALDNISERLKLQYGEKAKLIIIKSDNIFDVQIGLPL